MLLRKIQIAAVVAFVSAPAFSADEAMKRGTPITSENIVDVFEIQRIVSNLGDSFDREDWTAARDIFADEVNTTSGSSEYGVPEIKQADAIVARWAWFYEAADKLAVHHFTSNERVFFHDSDNASVFSKGVIVGDATPGGDDAATGGTARTFQWVD